MASGRLSKVKGKALDIPTVPTIGTATAGSESASVAFTASTKGGPVTTYTALSNPGSVTGSGTSSPVTVSGLTGGTAYTFTVRGNNATGSSEYTSASNSVTALLNTAYESIATATVGAGNTSATVTFSSISSSYTHLQLRVFARATASDSMWVRFNNDSGASSYDNHRLQGSGSVVGKATRINYSALWVSSQGYGISSTANIGSGIVMDILDYKNTNKYKVTRTLSGQELNTSNSDIEFTSGSWKSSDAVNRIDLTMNGSTFAEYTHIALYGIKGA